MKKCILIMLILGGLASFALSAQEIVFERTDVNGMNSNFVTATYSFGIDIKIYDIEHCSNVAFELSHNLAQYVQFSEYSLSEDWLVDSTNKDWSKVVTIVQPLPSDVASDQARIAIEAGTYAPASINSPNNPKIIHLEFVVLPNAPHTDALIFTISKIHATQFKDEIIELTIPTLLTYTYNIHSYIRIWPGDANCDGVADANDWANISKYLTYPKNSSRAFKREKANILWQVQTCIAWDTLAATYSDCDGNGIVTPSDQAVVASNMEKSEKAPHNDRCNIEVIPPDDETPEGNDDAEDPIPATGLSQRVKSTINKRMNDIDGKIQILNSDEIKENCKKIPINITNLDNNLIGMAGVINYSAQPGWEIVDIEAGEYFSENPNVVFYNNKATRLASFCLVNNFDKTPTLDNNTVAYVYVKENANSNNTLQIDDFIGFNKTGNVQAITQTVTGIDLSVNKSFHVSVYDKHLYLQDVSEEVENISIMNYIGEKVAEYSPNNDNVYNISNLSYGIFFVIVKTKNNIITKNFVNI